MANPDIGREHLRQIIDEFKEFCAERGAVSEADTRAKVITRVLTQVCGWPENEIDRESVIDVGRMDYRLEVHGKPHVVVEAKREGIAFTLPVDGARRTYTLDGALITDPPTKEAIYQVRAYCDDQGIRYAIATNGHAWIVFRAVRDDNVGWKNGHARVFQSLEDIYANFTAFWNFLFVRSNLRGLLKQRVFGIAAIIQAAQSCHCEIIQR